MTQRIHQGGQVLRAGDPLEKAKATMIMVHGRGASADAIIGLADELPIEGFAFLAPQAAGHTWYPYRFMEPLESNEPYLSSALDTVGELIKAVEAQGISRERIMLLGFSQGACLSLEYAARNAGRYGGVVALSGGLIGPDGTARDYAGSLDNTPVFLGCSDVDPHIPLQRVKDSAEIMRKLGGNVTGRIYPRMGHTINADEIEFVRGMMKEVVGSNE
ncbi:MAG: alpha/beta hydrolase [Anaerolineae bacterium]|nr:alpha/beta hydrolase [Anaerolineae bacterium]